MPRKWISPATRGKVIVGYDSLGRPMWRAPDDPVNKLMAKVVKRANGCWEWTGGTNNRGYGIITLRGARLYVHRASYLLHIGPIPELLELDHLCHSRDETCPGGDGCPHRRCVNPDHLEPVSGAENTRRGAARITHCPQGHPYDQTNTRIRSRGSRECSTCAREKARARYAMREICGHGHAYTPENTIFRADGTRWCRTCRETAASTRGGENAMARLSEDDVRAIRARAAAGVTQSSLAAEFGVTRGGISHVVRRTTWRHVP